MNKTVFKSRILELIKQKGISQAELAKKIGVSRPTIGKYVSGEIVPTADKLISIAEYFDVTTDYLLGLSDQKKLDMEILAISEYTGLSEEAINTLHWNTGATSSWLKNAPGAHLGLSFLLSDANVYYMLERYYFFIEEYESKKEECINIVKDFINNYTIHSTKDKQILAGFINNDNLFVADNIRFCASIMSDYLEDISADLANNAELREKVETDIKTKISTLQNIDARHVFGSYEIHSEVENIKRKLHNYFIQAIKEEINPNGPCKEAGLYKERGNPNGQYKKESN